MVFEFRQRGAWRREEYFALAREHGIVAFQAHNMDDPPRHFLPDGEWCKGDLLDHFGVRGDASVTATGQLGGTAFLVRKDDAAGRFFGELRDVFLRHFELCDDSPSKSPNLAGFVENRHDQSVFSLLGKKHGVFSLSAMEYDPLDGSGDCSRLSSDAPILAKHDKGGVRSLFPLWFKNVVHFATGGKI